MRLEPGLSAAILPDSAVTGLHLGAGARPGTLRVTLRRRPVAATRQRWPCLYIRLGLAAPDRWTKIPFNPHAA
ncbi:MAG: hypothetical protein R2856_10905 [Caldilineaceae bacterium]